MNLNADIDRKTEATLRAARAIVKASTDQPISFAQADAIAQGHGVELGIVLGHLTLRDVCAIDYVASKLQCVDG